METFKFDKEKAKNGLLLIAKSLGNVDRHLAFKIMYFADQKHLVKYGRPIFGDEYIAMRNGPVPSQTYDYVKYSSSYPDKFISHDGMFILPKGEVDMDEFSYSDLECLKESIEENKGLGFQELTNKSHQTAYNSTALNRPMSNRDIAREGGASDEMLQYMSIVAENLADEYC